MLTGRSDIKVMRCGELMKMKILGRGGQGEEFATSVVKSENQNRGVEKQIQQRKSQIANCKSQMLNAKCSREEEQCELKMLNGNC